MGILKIENTSKFFGGVAAVHQVNVTVEEGQILCIIGPNGAGKTTLFNLITGGYNLSTGTIKLKDKIISNLRPYQIHSLGIARTFQNIRLFKTMTVLENIMVGFHSKLNPNIWQALLPGISYKVEKKMKFRAIEAIEMVKLTDKKDELVSSLPYGEQRLVEIARALVSDPQIVLLDEPAAGMNIKESEDLLKLIQWIKTDLKKTVVFIEHNMKVVMKIAERIVVMDHGKKIAEGTPAEIQHNPLVIEAYLGKNHKVAVQTVEGGRNA